MFSSLAKILRTSVKTWTLHDPTPSLNGHSVQIIENIRSEKNQLQVTLPEFSRVRPKESLHKGNMSAD